MDKRFAIVIGVAAAGAMALGAQTASSSTGEPVDRVPPDLQLSGDKTQQAALPNRICNRDVCDVLVEVSCGDEACMVRTTGRLTKVKEDKLTTVGGRSPRSATRIGRCSWGRR